MIAPVHDYSAHILRDTVVKHTTAVGTAMIAVLSILRIIFVAVNLNTGITVTDYGLCVAGVLAAASVFYHLYGRMKMEERIELKLNGFENRLQKSINEMGARLENTTTKAINDMGAKLENTTTKAINDMGARLENTITKAINDMGARLELAMQNSSAHTELVLGKRFDDMEKAADKRHDEIKTLLQKLVENTTPR